MRATLPKTTNLLAAVTALRPTRRRARRRCLPAAARTPSRCRYRPAARAPDTAATSAPSPPAPRNGPASTPAMTRPSSDATISQLVSRSAATVRADLGGADAHGRCERTQQCRGGERTAARTNNAHATQSEYGRLCTSARADSPLMAVARHAPPTSQNHAPNRKRRRDG